MARKLSITVNNATFSAYAGEVLLDAALNQGIAMPHDCRSGQCGTCVVRKKRGELLGGETLQKGIFHACQARIFSDAHVTYDTLPAVRRVRGVLAAIERLAPDVRGLSIRIHSSIRYRPGQYYRVKFRGLPARCFSPTPPFVGRDDLKTIRFHVKLVKDGRVSSRIGTKIQPGHQVILEGPFGSAFFRPGEGRRLVLIASGTGFAPIWAIAKASLQRQPDVPLLLIAGARRLSSLYAAPALCRLATYPTADFIATAEDAQSLSEIILPGTPADHLPAFVSTDVIYAAGSPKLIEAVGQASARVGATFFADAFVATGSADESWLRRQMERVSLSDVKQRLSEWISSANTFRHPGSTLAQLHDGVGAVEDRKPRRQRRADPRLFWRNVA